MEESPKRKLKLKQSIPRTFPKRKSPEDLEITEERTSLGEKVGKGDKTVNLERTEEKTENQEITESQENLENLENPEITTEETIMKGGQETKTMNQIDLKLNGLKSAQSNLERKV